MIGWYIHHQGRGHLHRATAVAHAAAARGTQITGISSLPEPADWPSAAGWVQLARDDTPMPESTGQPRAGTEEGAPDLDGLDLDRPDVGGPGQGGFRAPTAAGALHWAPLHHPGLRRRSAQLSAWIDHAAPQLLVADVSVEIALLARLHGIPVVTVALPGDRSDPAHRLGYSVSTAVVGMWPAQATGILTGAPAVQALGGLSRFTPAPRDARPASPSTGRPNQVHHNQVHHDTGHPNTGHPSARAAAASAAEDPPLEVLVLSGAGGGTVPPAAVAQLRRTLPQARLRVLGGESDWEDDPWQLLQRADLVLTAAGQNSIAEVAASRTPALVTALDRPHQEQQHMLAALERGPWPAVRAPEPGDSAGWDRAVARALQLPGADWESWCDGAAALRFAELLEAMLPTPAPQNPAISHAEATSEVLR